MKLKYILFLVSISFSFVFSLEFKVASYNVENLFDLKYDGTEYNEYKPYSKYWDENSFTTKLHNISQVIKQLDSDIIALQEIESQNALDNLNKKLNYKYTIFIKNKKSSIGVALLSKFKIEKFERIIVDKYDKYSRDVLKVFISVENKPLIIYVNHWRSKRAKESFRIIYSTALKNNYSKLPVDTDYIILGDLNSNYNEFQTFKYDKKLNNTYGITGINQVLNTTIDKNFIDKNKIESYSNRVHYNLWLDINEKNRFSTKFKKEFNTPDNIIVPKGLFDSKNISYVNNSFGVFKPNYLYNGKYIKRWNKYRKKGYSDHLPIYAKFTTSTTKKQNITDVANINKNNINSLYKIQHIIEPIYIKNIIVIYKSDKISILKHNKNSKAIMVYGEYPNLKLGYRYDILVHKIDYYNGLKEIKELSILNKLNYDKSYKDSILDIKDIDLFDLSNQNQIVKNITGVYKNRYLYFTKNNQEKKIRLYFKKNIIKPKNNSKIKINEAQITIYKSNIQLTINKQTDLK